MMARNGAHCVTQLRCEQRMKVLLAGELCVGGARMSCRIHDISRGGACLESARPHGVGEPIQFVRGPLTASGRIAWVRGRRFGVRFDAPIRATDLLVQMSQSRKAAGFGEFPISPSS